MTTWVCYGRCLCGSVHTLYRDTNSVLVRLELDYHREQMELGETDYIQVWIQPERG